jgi:hypothetical protein
MLVSLLTGVAAFPAFDCYNASNQVAAYDLLEPTPCPKTESLFKVERSVWGEVVQLKRERAISIFRCQVLETRVSQFCGWDSQGGVMRFLKYREPKPVEAQDCRAALSGNNKGKIKINGKFYKGTIGTMKSHANVDVGSLADNGVCNRGALSLDDGRVLDKQVAQSVYEVILREEYGRLNDLSGTVSLPAGLVAKAGDLSLMDSFEGTFVWTIDKTVCPDTLVQLYRGPLKLFGNSTTTLEGSLALVEHASQAAGLELTSMFLLCGNSAYQTHLRNIALFIHPDPRITVATGKFTSAPASADTTKLESEISFIQIKASVSHREKISQVKDEICQNRREIAFTRLESVAGTDNPYALMRVFGRGHMVTKNAASVYVTRCNPIEVEPRSPENCTSEIPVTWNGTDAFVDPISFVLSRTGSPVRCNDIAPPRYLIQGQWICSYPRLKNCDRPLMLPLVDIKISLPAVPDGFGRSIYSPEQILEFQLFQESQSSRKAFLAETSEIAYDRRGEDGQWGNGLTQLGTAQVEDMIGMSFFPVYWVFGKAAVYITICIFGYTLVRFIVDVTVRAIAITARRGCGIWVLAALYSTFFQLLTAPWRWADKTAKEMGAVVGDDMIKEATAEQDLAVRMAHAAVAARRHLYPDATRVEHEPRAPQGYVLTETDEKNDTKV